MQASLSLFFLSFSLSLSLSLILPPNLPSHPRQKTITNTNFILFYFLFMLMCWKQKNGPAEGFRRRSVKLQWLKTAASAGVCWCIRQTWPFRCIMESVCVCLWYDFLSLMLAFDSQVSDCHLMGSDATDNAWHSSGDHPSIHPSIHPSMHSFSRPAFSSFGRRGVLGPQVSAAALYFIRLRGAKWDVSDDKQKGFVPNICPRPKEEVGLRFTAGFPKSDTGRPQCTAVINKMYWASEDLIPVSLIKMCINFHLHTLLMKISSLIL